MSEEINLNQFAGEWLKADMVDTPQVVLVPVGAGTTENDGKVQPHLEVEYEGAEYKLRLNKTNINKLREAGLKTLNEAVGKPIKFEKIKVNNPATKQTVDSLVIADIKLD